MTARYLPGVLFALAAGVLWGLVFIAPTLLPDYPPAVLACGRYLAFGVIALPLAAWDRARLRELSRADWVAALKLSAVGNLLYYFTLAGAIQRAGTPLPTMLIGTLPVVIALSSNWRGGPEHPRLPWSGLWPGLLLIGVGIALVNHTEMRLLAQDVGRSPSDHFIGALLAVVAVACWTWYPIRNADWLRANPQRSATTWATAQGVATLPLALIGFVAYGLWQARTASDLSFLVGPRPWVYLSWMLAIGLLASWLGTLCWNRASQYLPTTVVGQLIVFETLAALTYAFVLRGHAPEGLALAGIALLVLGVLSALRAKPLAHPG